MTNEYEMQNFWKQNKEEEKENYCFYSDLPSPLAYIELVEYLENESQQIN